MVSPARTARMVAKPARESMRESGNGANKWMDRKASRMDSPITLGRQRLTTRTNQFRPIGFRQRLLRRNKAFFGQIRQGLVQTDHAGPRSRVDRSIDLMRLALA